MPLDNSRVGMLDEEFYEFVAMAEGVEGLLVSDLGHRVQAFLAECASRDQVAYLGEDGYVHLEED